MMGMTIIEITTAFKGVLEGVKLLVDMRKDAGKADAVVALRQDILDLQSACIDQCARIEAECNARIAAEQKLMQLMDCRERLSHYAPVNILPSLLAYAPKAAFKDAEPLQLLCAGCREKSQIGVLQEVGNGHLCAGRGLDVRVKCSVCGETFLVQRNVWLPKVAYVG